MSSIPSEVSSKLRIDESAVQALVRWYCREAGVRQLAQKLERVCRKLALDVVKFQETDAKNNSTPSSSLLSGFGLGSGGSGGKGSDDDDDDAVTAGARCGWVVDEDSLPDFVGKPIFTSDRLYEGPPPPGVVMGLAWTSMGGTSLYVEVAEVPGAPDGSGGRNSLGSDGKHKSGNRSNDSFGWGSGEKEDGDEGSNGGGSGGGGGGSLMTTGQLGDVMGESCQIAYTLARNYLNRRCVGHQVGGGVCGSGGEKNI